MKGDMDPTNARMDMIHECFVIETAALARMAAMAMMAVTASAGAVVSITRRIRSIYCISPSLTVLAVHATHQRSFIARS